MAARRGVLRGGRLRHTNVDSAERGRGQGGRSTGFFEEEFGGELGLGFRGGDVVREREAPRSEARRPPGRAGSRGGRNTFVQARTAADDARVPRGRGGRAGAATIARGRGGRGGATRGARGDSGAAGAAISAGAGRRSSSASDQEDTWTERSGRGGRSTGRSSGSQGTRSEELLEVPEDSEGDQRERDRKRKNFQAEEERQLTRSVLRISQDPIIGNGQKGSSFWERIFKHYNEQRPFHFRPSRSLESKWGLIKHDVAKFIGVLAQCSNLNVSGASAADVQKKALQLYRLKSSKNTDFAYLHVWEIVKDVPRWSFGCTQEKTNAPIMKRKEVSSDSNCTFVQASGSTDGGGPPAFAGMTSRPQGSKHAKEDRQVTALRETAAIAQATATQAMADATLKKSEIMADANLFLLMTHSRDGVIFECATRYLKLRQEEELEKLETRLAEARARRATAESAPSPIPAESADVLQRRVDEAMSPSTQRSTLRRSRFQNQAQHDHDVTAGSSDAAGISFAYHGGSEMEAAAAGPVAGDHDQQDTNGWLQVNELEHGDQAGEQNSYGSHEGDADEEQQHESSNYEDLAGDAVREEDVDGAHEDPKLNDDNEDFSAAQEGNGGFGKFFGLDRVPRQSRVSSPSSSHGQYPMPRTLIHSEGSTQLEREGERPNSSNLNLQRIRQGFTPPRRASFETVASSNSAWFQSLLIIHQLTMRTMMVHRKEVVLEIASWI